MTYIPPEAKELDRRLGRRLRQKRHRLSGVYKTNKKKARVTQRSGAAAAKKFGKNGKYESLSKCVARSASSSTLPMDGESSSDGASDSDSDAGLPWAEYGDTDAELGDTDGDWVFRANAGDSEKRFWHNTRTEETRWTIKRAGE